LREEETEVCKTGAGFLGREREREIYLFNFNLKRGWLN